MATATALLSIDEQIRALPNRALYEIFDEEVREIQPMGMLAGSFANYLAFFINSFAMPKKLGMAFVEVIYRLRPNRPHRRPDVSFIAASEWPANLRPDLDPPSLDTVPSLAVEVIGPRNTATEIEEKRLEYFDSGVQVVWVVHPIARTIHVWNNRDECRVVAMGGTLDGGTAIPGFQLKVDDLFAAMFPVPPGSVNGTP